MSTWTPRVQGRRFAVGLFSLAAAAGLALTVAPAPSQALSGPAVAGDEAAASGTIPGEYVVVYRDQGLSAAESRTEARELTTEHGGDIEHQLGRSLDGFAAELTPDQARAIAADPEVDYLQPVHRMGVHDVQPNPPSWGLDRVDQRGLPLSSGFEHPSTAGRGAHVYVIDTGINAAHADFTGRVGAGRDFIDGDTTPTDCNGHGTHVAGTAVGTSHGVAKKATVHAVRVLDCAGSGTSADFVAAIDWVIANAVRPAVVNLSAGCDVRCFDPALEAAVANLLASGITWVQAAGNMNDDACLYSPSQVPQAINVGATASSDQKASFSNRGACVDIWAPGTNIVSAAHDSQNGTRTYSGTSMASPHVAGAAALYLGSNPSASPTQVHDAILGNATAGAVSGLDTQSPNRLLYTGFVRSTPAPGPTSGCGARTAARDVRIRDLRTATSPLALSCAGSASASSRVTVDIAHPAIGHLSVSLQAPDGSRYVLHRRTGGRTDNITKTYQLNLAAEPASGTWRLVVNDGRRRSQGTLRSWGLDA